MNAPAPAPALQRVQSCAESVLCTSRSAFVQCVGCFKCLFSLFVYGLCDVHSFEDGQPDMTCTQSYCVHFLNQVIINFYGHTSRTGRLVVVSEAERQCSAVGLRQDLHRAATSCAEPFPVPELSIGRSAAEPAK
eukprot:scpid37552/ scgid16323/ 